MTDRNVQYPKRYQQAPVPGTTNIFDFTPAPGEVYEEGTIINKATLLKDATAALFGLGTDAVPDDVLAYVGRYNQHWWRRRGKETKTVYDDSVLTKIPLSDANDPNINWTFRYSDTVEIQTSNTVKLPDNSPYIQGTYNTYTSFNVLVGKYTTNRAGDTVYRIPEGQTTNRETYSSGGLTYYRAYLNGYKQLVSVTPAQEWQYIQSSDRSAYPDSGEQDGYEYEYLGIPFENAVGAPKIETGSYVGTGTYGASNPNSLTFGFVPILVFLTEINTLSIDGPTPGLRAMFTVPSLSNNFSVGGYVVFNSTYGSNSYSAKVNGTTLSWYSSQDATEQFNRVVSGTPFRYDYIAIR